MSTETLDSQPTSLDRAARTSRLLDTGGRMLPKVPHVAAAFWAVKLLTTGMGEALADSLGDIPVVAAVVLAVAGVAGLVLTFRSQLRARSYHPLRYWGTVALIAVFGTVFPDGVHDVLGVPYPASVVVFTVILLAVLAWWRRSEGTISIHSITTRRREWFYWGTVLATFALGTAAGDLTANTLALGYGESIVLFGGIMVALLAAWRFAHLPTVPMFWAAYVFTRPLGASVADWLAKPAASSGLGFGDIPVALVALALFAGLMTWLVRSGRDEPRDADLV